MSESGKTGPSLWRQYWPEELLRRRHRLARCDAVLAAIEALRAEVDARPEANPILESREADALRTEVTGLLKRLDDSEAVQDFEKTMPLPPAYAKEREDVPRQAVSAWLRSISRGLEAHRVILRGGIAPAGMPPPLPPAPRAEFTPSEAALLASLTEKFYGSWAFKGVGLALVAAVALAAGGTALIGAQSFELSRRLDAKGAEGEAALKRASDTWKESLTQQGDAIKRQSELTKDEQGAFRASVVAAKAEVKQLQEDFASATKRNTVDQVIADLRKDLERHTGPITGEIQGKATEYRDRLRVLEEKSLKPVAEGLSRLTDAVDKEEMRLDPLRPRLGSLMQDADRVSRSVHQIGLHETTASAAAGKALQHEEAARGALDAAKRQQEALAEIARDVVTLRQSLNAAEGVDGIKGGAEQFRAALATLRRLEERVGGSERKIEALPIPALLEQTKRLDSRVASLESPDKPAPPSKVVPPRREEDLAEADRCHVQRKLAGLGFRVGIDGEFGRETRQAIAAWQRRGGQASDGNLTPDQIGQLLGPGPAPPCPALPRTRRR